MENLKMFVPITKVDAVQRLVYGSLATEAVDKSGEIFDYATSKPFVEEWSGGIAKATEGKSVGNLRAMHGKVAAGKFTELTCNDEGKRIDVCAKVVDDAEWTKVQEGCYTGFSIGGSYVKKWKDGDHTRYTANPSEGSLVDLPCNPEAQFVAIKADGTEELRKFQTAKVDPIAPAAPAAPGPDSAEPPDLAQVWQAKDGKTFGKKADAESHNAELVKAAAAANDPTTKLAAAITAATETVTKLEAPRPAAVTETPTAAAPAEALPVAKKDFSDDERKKMADKGEAMPDGSFPIANKGDLENAIKAFGRAKNKKAVKSHIQKRAKDLGAEDALPDAWKSGADKALVFGDLRKGLGAVGRLAYLLEELEWLQQSCEYEAEHEGDDSPVPAKLKSDIASLCATLNEMVSEETSELFTNDEAIVFADDLEMSARPRGVDALAKRLGDKAPAWLAKVGARHSKSDKEHLDAAHDHLSKMGVGCGKAAKVAEGDLAKAGARHSKADTAHLESAHDSLTKAGASCEDEKDDKADKADKAAPISELAKALDAEREKSGKLEKAVADATSAITSLHDRLKKLEDQELPDPRDRAYRVVDKAADSAAAIAHLQELAKTDPMQVAKALVHMAQQNPQKMMPTPR